MGDLLTQAGQSQAADEAGIVDDRIY